LGQTSEHILAQMLQKTLDQKTLNCCAKAVDRLLAWWASTKPARHPSRRLTDVVAVDVHLKPDTIADDIADIQKLKAYRQMQSGIRNSERYLIAVIDIAKKMHLAFFGGATGFAF
jgi:hypothetical protein